MTGRRRVPVVVVLPPRTLLLDVAGPIEVLRVANVVQDRVVSTSRMLRPPPSCAVRLACSSWAQRRWQLLPRLEGRNHLHPVVHRARDAIAADPARDWSLDDLAHAAHASSRRLSRLFNALPA